jgi:regulator of sigma D
MTLENVEILRSKTAIQVNVEIMRTFVKLRGILETNKDIAKKLEQLEQRFSLHDQNFKVVFDAIRKLMASEMPITQKKIRGLNND